MVWSAIALSDAHGNVLLKQIFENKVSEKDLRIISSHIATNLSDSHEPIIYMRDISTIFMKKLPIIMMLLTKSNSNIVSGFSYLESLYSLIFSYIGPLNVHTIGQNLILLYEILDESMISGIPQLTDYNLMKEYISDDRNRSITSNIIANTLSKTSKSSLATYEAQNVPEAVTNAKAYRAPNIFYKINEVYVDFIEELNYKSSKSGNISQSEIIGTIVLRSSLSGMPQIKMFFNNKFPFDDDDNNHNINNIRNPYDFKFHQCVSNRQTKSQQNILTFMPPDGKFVLLNYRVPCENPPVFELNRQISYPDVSTIRYDIIFKIKFHGSVKPESLVITVPVHENIDSPKFSTKYGSVKYLPETDSIQWDLSSSGIMQNLFMSATFKISKECVNAKNEMNHRINPFSTANEIQKPTTISFLVPFYSMSGMQVLSMSIFEKSCYKVDKYISSYSRDGKVNIF